ncbi:MAG: hypothetical protein ACE5FL_04515 [Myxococcota bacterium]
MRPAAADGSSTRQEVRHLSGFLLAGAALCLLKLWLVAVQPLNAYADNGYDDRLFVELAASLLGGQWLGPYDSETLIKGPGYPLWIAATARSGLPLLLSQHLLYAAACAAFVPALRPLIESRGARFAIFGALLFAPQSFSLLSLRVIREGNFYSALSLGVVAGAVGLFARSTGPLRRMAGWSAATGFTLGWFWITREEGPWILPTALLLLTSGAAAVWSSSAAARPGRYALLALPLFLVAGAVTGVAALNLRHYGVFTSVELTAKPFASAYGALARVSPADGVPRRRIPVPKDSRSQIYAVSPAFAELRPLLEGDLGERWANASAETLGPEGAGEIGGGWFLWALRAAAYLTHHHRSAPAAARYYGRIAEEVNSACDDGRLRCGPLRETLLAPWRFEFTSVLARHLMTSAVDVASFAGNVPGTGHSRGPRASLDLFRSVTANRVAPFEGEDASRRAPAPLDTFRLRVLRSIHHGYALAGPIAGIAAVFALGISAVRELRARRMSRISIVNAALLAAITARLVSLAYIETTAFPTSSYRAPLFPLFVLLCGTAIVAAMESPEEDPMGKAPRSSRTKKRVEAMGVTIGVLAAFAVLFLLTENGSAAPFSCAIS